MPCVYSKKTVDADNYFFDILDFVLEASIISFPAKKHT